MSKVNILVSACLLGRKCRYDGCHSFSAPVNALKQKYNLVPVCPEVMAGMNTPRTPSEKKGDCVIDKFGNDVTEIFVKGAKKCLDIAQKKNCKAAILKSKSPSCGVGEIYDGTFSNITTNGNGILTDLLLRNGIKVYSQNDIKKVSF